MGVLSPAGRQLIQRFEGFAPTAYRCPAGVMTIGYGHVIKPWEQFGRISEAEADAMLAHDVRSAEQSVRRLIHVPLTSHQCDALVSFTFNLGGGALQRSTLRRKVNGEEHHAVPEELMKWVWAGGRKLQGLVRRRKAEALHYSGS